MQNPRSTVTTAVAVQAGLLAWWALAQLTTFVDLIWAARQPGAENYAPSLVIAGSFAACLVAAVVVSTAVSARGLRSLNMVLRLELGVIGLGIVTAISIQGIPGLVVIAAFLLACGIFAVSLRTRLE